MRQFIFGCILFICGVFGGTGWVLARAIMASAHGWVDLSHLLLFGLDDWNLERFFIISFYLIAVIGAVIAIKAIIEEK